MPRPRAALIAVLLTAFLSFFEFTSVFVALPAIQDDLAASYGAVQWVSVGFALPFALLLVSGGRTGDWIGQRSALLLGLAGFVVASAAAGAATGIGALVAARAVQGAAAALFAPQVVALLRVLVPEGRRAAATAAYAVTAGVATMAGPALGGWLVEADLFGLGWRSIVLTPVPLGLLAGTAAVVGLPRGQRRRRPGFDAGGFTLAAVALLLLLVPLSAGRDLVWPWWSPVALVAAVGAGAALVGHQRRRHRAGLPTLVAVPLLSDRTFAAGLATNLVVASLLTGFLFVLAVHLQDGLGRSPAHAGAEMAVAPLAMAVASAAVPRLAARSGSWMLPSGASLVAVAFVLTATGATSSGGGRVAVLCGLGAGIGLVSTTVQTTTMNAAPAGDAGAAAGLFATSRQVGAAVGVAVNGVVYLGVQGAVGDHDAALRAAALLNAAGALLLVLMNLAARVRHATPDIRPGSRPDTVEESA